MSPKARRGLAPPLPPPWPMLAVVVAVAVVAALAGTACGAPKQTSVDAAADYVPLDMSPPSDATPRPLALDFSATGCGAFDPVTSRCDGTAPLALRFTPIGSEELIQFLWDFGDGTATSSERSPTHVYALPDSYTVTLVAGGGPGVGSVLRRRLAYVNASHAPAGARCDVDLQCADGLSCWCGSSNPCTPILSRGLCGRPCDAAAGGPASCPQSTICSDLSSASSAPATATTTTSTSWRRPLCLPSCVGDQDCTTGFQCRDLLGAPPPAGTWVRACFAPYPLAIGARCGDAMGFPTDADCASRLCADLGAYGRCAADCAVAGCPMGTACAQFGDGRKLCLAACAKSSGATSAACTDDPLLACEPPGIAGPLGFVIAAKPGMPAVPGATYCAPKKCATTADCGPAGSCPTGGGSCKRLPRT